jgi:flagellar assembly protein FliH
MATPQALRRPTFLARVGGTARVENAAFKTTTGTRFRPQLIASGPGDEEDSQKTAAAALAEANKLATQFAERTSSAIDVLRATTERLAAEVRSDALEIGFLVARRILEMELSASPEPLVNLVRTAVRRLGESRKITIRLAPPDAEAITAAMEARGAQVLAPASISKIDIVPDGSLGRGDCLVEGDLVTVDGRITARIEELRRVLDASGEESAP